MEEDQRKHKKQRHTQTRIYNRLVKDCGYTGGQRTVTTYVALKKKELAVVTEKYLDLVNFAMWVRVATKEYLQEIHYEKKQPIHTLFEEEKAKLLYLPNEPFEVYRLDSAVLDKYEYTLDSGML